MKTASKCNLMNTQKPSFHGIVRSALALAFTASTLVYTTAAETGQVFPSPEAAVRAIVAAAAAKDFQTLHVIFGPAANDLENPDRVQGTNDFDKFVSRFNRTNRIVYDSDSRCSLEIDTDFWPFPIPIVKGNAGWHFDTEAGREEIVNRRIGENELATLATVRTYVVAQREYASSDRDGDSVLEYAQKIGSSPGTRDGLYWPPGDDGEISPLGPMAAGAQNIGHNFDQKLGAQPEPFQGYYFQILTQQGKHAPGGKYKYIINGNMIGGFALVAWPAYYGETGIMTFIVNQQGRVYQKDLGLQTAKIAAAMKEYNPDMTWTISRE
jgi:hypothetical protein